MCRLTLESPKCDLNVNVIPKQDFMTCLLPALIAAIPCFINAYMDCLAGNSTGGSFKPGGPERCGT